MSDGSVERSLRRAKARLVNMVVHEVSLVDKPANERPFVLVKADQAAMKTKKTDATPPPAAAPAAAVDAAAPPPPAPAAKPPAEEDAEGQKKDTPLVLSPELKQALVDALSNSIETINALATVVADAQVQDGAPPPPDLFAMIQSACEELEGIAEQYGPQGPPADAGSAAPPGTGDQGGPPAGAANMAAPPASSAPAGQADLVAAVEQAMERVIDRRMAGTGQKSEEATTKAIEKKLEGKVGELLVLVKSLKAAEILAPLIHSRPAGNANPVEKTETSDAKKSETVSWPGDMSAAFTKPPKAVSPADSR